MNKLVLIIVTVFSVTYSHCQKYIGFKIGCNYSLIESKSEHYTNDIESKFSYEVGVNAKIPIIENFDLVSELEYINYSTHIHSIGFSPSHSRDYNYDLKLGYLSINILPQYSIGKNKLFFFNIGPYLSILVHSNMSGVLEGYGPTADFTGEILSGSANNYFKNVDAGFLTSAGLRIKMANQLYISPQIRYRYGLVNFGDDYFVAYDMPIYIRSLSFSVTLEAKIKD